MWLLHLHLEIPPLCTLNTSIHCYRGLSNSLSGVRSKWTKLNHSSWSLWRLDLWACALEWEKQKGKRQLDPSNHTFMKRSMWITHMWVSAYQAPFGYLMFFNFTDGWVEAVEKFENVGVFSLSWPANLCVLCTQAMLGWWLLLVLYLESDVFELQYRNTGETNDWISFSQTCDIQLSVIECMELGSGWWCQSERFSRLD